MKYKKLIAIYLLLTSLFSSHVSLNASHIETDETRLKNLTKIAQKPIDENEGINTPLSLESELLKKDIVSYLENTTETLFDLERMQHSYTPFFYIHLFKRIQLSTFAENTALPIKESFQIYSNRSEAFLGKIINGYRVAFSFGSENIFLGIFPAQLESDFGVYNIERLFSYKQSVFSPKRTFSPQTVSKALKEGTQVLIDCKGGKWAFSNNPSKLFITYFSIGNEKIEFFSPIPLLPRIKGSTSGFNPRATYSAFEAQDVFEIEIGLRVKLPHNPKEYETMVLSLNYQPTLDEMNLIYPDTFRKKLSSSQKKNYFTDVIFFTEN